MDKIAFSEFNIGRRIVGRLPHKKDLIKTIEELCISQNIEMATFSLIGAVSSATYGAYDQKQQVYVTLKVEDELEIIHCSGNVSLKDGKPFVHAHITFGDIDGKAFGGHLFSETIIFAGEIDLQELTGKPFNREYDKTTGLMLWKI